MAVKNISLIVLLSLLAISCATIKTTDFFKLKENNIETYNGIFIKNPHDSNYRQIEQLFGSISKSDTITDKSEIIYKTTNIGEHKAFYATETIDTLKQNSYIGLRHFLFSALIFSQDTIFLAPVLEKTALKKLKFEDFKYKIPPFLSKRDSVVIIDRKKRMVLCNFHKTKLLIGKKSFSNCLAFEIREIWPDAKYKGKVWLHQKYGLLKWIRSTGKVETRIL